MPRSSELDRDEIVVAVADAAEVATTLAAAHQAGDPVVVRGAGTKLDWGAPPRSVRVIVDVSRLDRILDHAAGDLVVQVQAGVRLADLQTALAPAGQRLALDEMVAGSTIGGVIATGLSGPLRLAHGSVRDMLLGVTVVLADGRSATSGGRVVKNVAGYDLGKLYTGSFGTLGVVTEAFLRLHPVPERAAWIGVDAADAVALDGAVETLSGASIVPAAIEVHDPGTGAFRVVALVEGTDHGVDGRLAAALRQLASDHPEVDGDVMDEAPAWWGRLPGLGAEETLIKLTTVIAEVSSLLTVLRAEGVPLEVTGSAGAGVLYAGLPADVAPEAVARTLNAARRACARVGGSAVVLRAPATVRALVDAWGPVAALDLMRRVKDGFDPEHILAPGRFVGGI